MIASDDLCRTLQCRGKGSYTKLFTVLERDLCAENKVNCRSNGSCVKLFYCYRTGSHFTVLERDLCAENTVHCGGNGSCVKLDTHKFACECDVGFTGSYCEARKCYVLMVRLH